MFATIAVTVTAAHHGSSLVPGGVELAQVNIARLRAPISGTLLVDFVALLQPVNCWPSNGTQTAARASS